MNRMLLNINITDGVLGNSLFTAVHLTVRFFTQSQKLDPTQYNVHN